MEQLKDARDSCSPTRLPVNQASLLSSFLRSSAHGTKGSVSARLPSYPPDQQKMIASSHA